MNQQQGIVIEKKKNRIGILNAYDHMSRLGACNLHGKVILQHYFSFKKININNYLSKKKKETMNIDKFFSVTCEK